MRPIKIEYYETANGPVKTLTEWKHAGVFELLKGWKDNSAEGMNADAFTELVGSITGLSDALIAILSVKESDRPNGKRDSKPRKKPAILAPTTPTA